MKKLYGSAAAAIALASMSVLAAPAEARQYERGYRSGGHGSGGALVAGIIGVAVGAALASSGRGYGRGYYGHSYGYRAPSYGVTYYSRPAYRGGYYRPAPQAYYGRDYAYDREYGYRDDGYGEYRLERRHDRQFRRDERLDYDDYDY